MSNPSVACVMLASGRPQMVARTLRSFQQQTYDNRLLIIWDTGDPPLNIRAEKTVYCRPFNGRTVSIGELRNEAIGLATNADIIVTMDSDDWSHPQRIEEQVQLLEASGADAVGYNEVLFWDERIRPVTLPAGGKCGFGDGERNEAYLYSNPQPNYAVGASLCFWRSAWQRHPFPHLPIPGNKQCAGEDGEWLKGVDCCGGVPRSLGIDDGVKERDPRLICSIHGSNDRDYSLAMTAPQFKRMPSFDAYCREAMKL